MGCQNKNFQAASAATDQTKEPQTPICSQVANAPCTICNAALKKATSNLFYAPGGAFAGEGACAPVITFSASGGSLSEV